MMGVRRLAATDQARLLGNQFNVITVANPPRRRQREHTLIYSSGPPPLSAAICAREPRPGFLRHGLISCSFGHKTRQLCLESLLDELGIECGQSVLAASTR